MLFRPLKLYAHVYEAKIKPETYHGPAQRPSRSNSAMDSQELVAVTETDRMPTGSFNIGEVTTDQVNEKQEQDDS